MDQFIELIKILAPATLMLYLSYLLVRSFLSKQLEEQRITNKLKTQEQIQPIRLQAYERICLLLERISPKNLITRLNNAQYSAKEFQQIAINEIRNEYNHNLSQQLYMSNEAWAKVENSVENTITLINEVSAKMGASNSSVDLAKNIFDRMVKENLEPSEQALTFLKSEIRELF